MKIHITDVLTRCNLRQIDREELLAERTNIQEKYQLFDRVLLGLNQEVIEHLRV